MGHTVDAKWRDADAVAFETRVTAVNDWLEHTEDLVEMFKDDTAIASELRGVAGSLRSRRDDFGTSAERLRVDMNGKKE